jgi:hypothetical protein
MHLRQNNELTIEWWTECAMASRQINSFIMKFDRYLKFLASNLISIISWFFSLAQLVSSTFVAFDDSHWTWKHRKTKVIQHNSHHSLFHSLCHVHNQIAFIFIFAEIHLLMNLSSFAFSESWFFFQLFNYLCIISASILNHFRIASNFDRLIVDSRVETQYQNREWYQCQCQQWHQF